MVKILTQTLISDRLSAAGVSGPLNIAGLAGYVDLLVKWNKKINLTSLDIDPLTDAAIDRLIVEPVIASGFVPRPDLSVIDLGSGGGSPAIPFKLQIHDSTIRLVESRSRKCAFLREAVRHLGLDRATVEESRFELLNQRRHLAHSADLITVRAVRVDDDLVDLVRWLLSPGGLIFRFATSGDTALPSCLRITDSHPLISGVESELQIIRLIS